MAKLKIDLDDGILYEVTPDRRPPGGVSIRKDPDTGADVFMYKRRPGIYFSANGVEVSMTMAARAGFDVERLARIREKNLKIAEFETKYNAQLLSEERRIIEERNGYKLVDLGGNRFVIEDEEGTNMTKGKVAPSEQHGRDWLADFAGPVASPGANIVPEIKDGVVSGGNIQRIDGPDTGGVDRRAGSDGRSDRDVGKAGNKKAAIPA